MGGSKSVLQYEWPPEACPVDFSWVASESMPRYSFAWVASQYPLCCLSYKYRLGLLTMGIRRPENALVSLRPCTKPTTNLFHPSVPCLPNPLITTVDQRGMGCIVFLLPNLAHSTNKKLTVSSGHQNMQKNQVHLHLHLQRGPQHPYQTKPRRPPQTPTTCQLLGHLL
jgi:hypothetical protein